MNKRQFVHQRRPAWDRFETLVRQLERSAHAKLKAGEVEEFSRLFRELSNDLAVVRSRAFGAQLDAYLNHLVSRGHSVFYRTPSGNLQQVARFLMVGFPRLFRANLGYFLVAAALFFVPFGISWAVVQNNPGLGARVVEQEMLDQVDAMYDYDPDDPDRPGFDESRAAMGGFYVYNNVGIALRCFAGGILLGTLTIYVLLSNGISIGAIAGYLISQGHTKSFTSFIISHGSFELTAIAVSGGAGLMLGTALLHPGQRTRLEALKVRGFEATQIACGAAAMLVVAALLEAFWSPAGIPSIIKYVVGTGLWVLVFLYLGLAGRERSA